MELRQANNKVYIEGIFAENKLKPTTYMKNGVSTEALGGSIVVKVDQPMVNESVPMMIEVFMFANKYTNGGSENPSYKSLKQASDELVSISAAGNEEGASKIRVTGELRMNEYFSPQDGRFISFPRVHASFINKIVHDFNPHATFECEGVIMSMDYAVDADGVEIEPKKLNMKFVVPQYGNKVDIIPFVVNNPKVIATIEDLWQIQDTVPFSGRLDYRTISEEVKRSGGFGEELTHARTKNIQDLVITGGNDAYDSDTRYDLDDINTAIANRKAYLQDLKNRPPKTKAAPAPKSNGFSDLGF